jgi:hypothetical protein
MRCRKYVRLRRRSLAFWSFGLAASGAVGQPICTIHCGHPRLQDFFYIVELAGLGPRLASATALTSSCR